MFGKQCSRRGDGGGSDARAGSDQPVSHGSRTTVDPADTAVAAGSTTRNPRNLTYKIAHGCSAAPLVRHASVAPPMFPWAFLILIAAQVSATPNVRRVEGRLQLRKILEDSAAWVVYYHDGEEIELPRGELDTREAAWFAKLAQIWERDVRHGRVPWATDSMAPLQFASADRSTLLADGASDLFDSEFADLPLGPRLYENSGDRGPMPGPMSSRKAMQAVLKHLDTELADGRPSGSSHEEL